MTKRHPIVVLVATRCALGVLTLFLVSLLVFAAVRILPGNVANAVLGQFSSPETVAALNEQLGLNDSLVSQYLDWITGLLTGDLGESLANGTPVGEFVSPRAVNSAVLVVLAGTIGAVLGVGLGALAAMKRGKASDHVMAYLSLGIASLPEFVVGLTLVILFATLVLPILPAVSLLPPGTYAWERPEVLVLPVATLVIVITPYILRMMRAATIEALESDYAEMATLEGISRRRILLFYALPNALAPTVQVIGLMIAYCAGGIVLVEYVFAYPGIGSGLVDAVNNRDIPVIQFIVLALAAFYLFMNIITDAVVLAVTPRRRVKA